MILMKKSWTILTLLAISILAAGCSTGSTTSSGNVAEGVKTSPAEGGTLIIVRASDANSLDPQYSTQINSMAVYHHKILEGLVTMDKNSEYQGALATDWKQLDDVTWQFTLRENVTFHDGTDFNAEAVKLSFERIPKTPKAGMFSMIKSIEAVNEHSINIHLEYPYSPILSLLASAEAGIISPSLIEQTGTDIIKEPIGTGPYTFDSWTQGQEIVLSKNENYWGEQPSLDKVIFKTVPEDATRVAMVEAGEAHVAEQLPVTEISRVESSERMKLGRYEAFSVDHIGFNTSIPPFDDARVRQAVAHAVDKESIVSGVYNNVGQVSDSTLGPSVIGYSDKVKGYDYDLNQAKALLEEAGYRNGLEATIIVSDNKTRISVAEVLQSQLKGIGLNLKVQTMEFGAYIDAASKGESQMFISGWGNATGDADYNQYNMFHSTSKGVPGNHSFYDNPEVDQLIEEARKETDPAKRITLYEEAQTIELKDAALIPFRNGENLAAISKEVDGIWISPSGFVEINNVQFLK